MTRLSFRQLLLVLGPLVLCTLEAPAFADGGGLHFVPMTPCRVVDTRNAAGTFGGPIMAAGSTRQFPIPIGSCSVPSSAAAYSVNVGVFPQAALGYLTIWPAGETRPLISTVNSDGRAKINAAIVPSAAAGAGVDVYVSDTTHVVIDINGYFTNSTALDFYPVTSCRFVNTRYFRSLSGGSSESITIPLNACSIPSSAQAYLLNFTVLPHGPLSYLTSWPTGQAQPAVPTVIAPTGEVTANAAIIPAGNSGSITVFASDDTDLLIDVSGYFAPEGSGGLGLYIPSTPCRVLDTRKPLNSPPFSGNLVVNVTGSSCGSSLSSAQAFVANATVVPGGFLGWLTLWADGALNPIASTLNSYDGAVTSNMAIVPTTNGSIDAYASNSTHLILDISSYFAP